MEACGLAIVSEGGRHKGRPAVEGGGGDAHCWPAGATFNGGWVLGAWEAADGGVVILLGVGWVAMVGMTRG